MGLYTGKKFCLGIIHLIFSIMSDFITQEQKGRKARKKYKSTFLDNLSLMLEVNYHYSYFS